MKIEIEGSVKEITDFVREVRSRLFQNSIDSNTMADDIIEGCHKLVNHLIIEEEKD